MTSAEAAAAATTAITADPVERIAQFARRASFETTRLSAAELAEVRAAIPADTEIFVAAIPSRPLDEQVETSKDLRNAGFEPVPHLAARNFASVPVLDEFVRRLAGEAGVKRALVIAGDRSQPAGTLTESLDIIRSGVLQRHGIHDIGIAGHPEGHPRISADVLIRATDEKLAEATCSGLKVRLVTQFTMSTEPIVEWLLSLRARGIDNHVGVGLAGPANLKTLLRFARICGVQTSVRGLARNTGLVRNLFSASTADPIVRALAESAGKLGDIAPHFFSFGGLPQTARWVGAVAAGRITLNDEDGFEVNS